VATKQDNYRLSFNLMYSVHWQWMWTESTSVWSDNVHEPGGL